MQQRRNNKRGFCLPGYNWCGPGCSGPGAPVNEVDAACMMHDLCYDSGRGPCICDREFLERLRPLVNRYTESGRHAGLIQNYMRIRTNLKCGSPRHESY
ncbi:phospholipase [Psychrobacillus sp. FSL K6-4046]|uniref:phospholipase n=1 Tax=Psychrobacillus sp. FSL K6-4046 TaxID=2921550 RepID=UPI00315B1CBC